jgi:hypothetical protein
MSSENNFEKSIVVSAHPDDEILWFSSIVDRVDEVVLCYLNCPSKLSWSEGRRRSLLEYSMKNISCLGITESDVFSDANFCDPLVTKYGIKIKKKSLASRKYIENFYILKNKLKTKLIGCLNVFTHNPWGEYGNEEHVQVYRAVRDLQGELGFTLWFSNYFSNKSHELMLRYSINANSEYVTLKTNKIFSNNIKRLYQKNGCWTWYDDWVWFDQESFIKDKQLDNGNYKYGHMFPLNLINVKIHSTSDNECDMKPNIFSLFSIRRK